MHHLTQYLIGGCDAAKEAIAHLELFAVQLFVFVLSIKELVQFLKHRMRR